MGVCRSKERLEQWRVEARERPSVMEPGLALQTDATPFVTERQQSSEVHLQNEEKPAEVHICSSIHYIYRSFRYSNLRINFSLSVFLLSSLVKSTTTPHSGTLFTPHSGIWGFGMEAYLKCI